MSLLRLEGVAKHVPLSDGGDLRILTDVDLEVQPGDRVSVVGRSGSGKSTLLNILGLLDEPSHGRLWFEDQPLERLPSRTRDLVRGREVGFVFQQFNLLPGRTVLENVTMPLLYARGAQFWRRNRIAADLLDRVGLSHRLQAKPDQLSGGEQQRVAIARALVRSPRLILADEPTGALDLETGAAVMRLLYEVAASTDAALITITHDTGVAALADRHLRLEQGTLLAAASAGVVA